MDHEVPDSELVKQAQAGDFPAYEELMRRYQPRIYALALRMTSSPEDSEDILQEVFVRAHAALQRFQGKSSFYTWVYRIALNRTINFLKKRKRRTGLSLDDPDTQLENHETLVEEGSKDSPVREIQNKELREKLNEAIQQLSENHRTVVVLHDIQGVPHNEIGEMLGLSSGTVRSRLFYARQQLQAWLSEYVK